MLVSIFHRLRAARVDDHHRRSAVPGGLQQGEHMDIGDDGVTPPDQDRAAIQEILGGMTTHGAIAAELSSDSSTRTQAPHRLGDTAPEVEKTIIERLQKAHGTSYLLMIQR